MCIYTCVHAGAYTRECTCVFKRMNARRRKVSFSVSLTLFLRQNHGARLLHCAGRQALVICPSPSHVDLNSGTFAKRPTSLEITFFVILSTLVLEIRAHQNKQQTKTLFIKAKKRCILLPDIFHYVGNKPWLNAKC